jgi:serine phosphatase RsbU (regulator of sigma subunit)/anti-sigma regulatory factor (Ser/Thr protein kinase)
MAVMESLRRTLRPRTAGDVAPTGEVTEVGLVTSGSAETDPATASAPAIEIAPTDPLFALLQSAPGVVDIGRLELESPALRELRAGGVTVIVPLVTQGELIGALYLGPRLSDQVYSTDDRRLLSTLAAQAAPAIRVAQLVAEQAAEIQARERLDQELRLATLIQQQFLPRTLPELPDWQVAAYYGPARAVGGDFYDFIELPAERIGVVIGDVTDKGVPAALVMARTHSVLRSEAPRLVAPGAVLARANELLCAEMPPNMFVTCLYGVLEPASGRLVFANAGHNLPYVRTGADVRELRATGMPLGLLPGMAYEEVEATVAAGESLLIYSDGFVEAHAPGGEMYGFDRLRSAFTSELAGSELIDALLDDLRAFTGRDWEQEDDLTVVNLRRSADSASATWASTSAAAEQEETLLDEAIAGELGNERIAMDHVIAAVAPLGLPADRLERLKTAVSETAMNAIEYGSRGQGDVPIRVRVSVTDSAIRVRVVDAGLGGDVPIGSAEIPDIDAKLAGLQKPRGWGLFLIEQMVDEVAVEATPEGQAVVLTMHRGAT